MESLLKKWDISRHFLPRLVTKMYQIEEDREQWINAAEDLFDKDVKVAQDLLEDYAENSYKDFIRIGQRLWNADLFKNELSDLIFKNISRVKSPGFYKKNT